MNRLILGQIENAAYVPLPWEMPEIDYVDTRLEHDLSAYRQFLEACYCLQKYDLKEIDLIHSFNAVCKTDRPWIASFETTMPRIWPQNEDEKNIYVQLIDWMKKDNCKTLYAMSRNAYDIQRYMLSQYLLPADVDMLMEKTKILYPPQKIIISQDQLDRKYSTKKLNFLFVGRTFFKKGGRETIRSLSEFAGEYDFKLTLVSSLDYNDYVTHATYEDKLKWKKIIQEKEWIEYYEALPNEMVLEKCREASVGLLPSFGDTFGYAVLEMQAAGCPVITTDLRAFPETNNDDCGWVCRLPTEEEDTDLEWDDEVWSRILEQELRRCFQEIFHNPEIISIKGRKALNRIKEMHDPYKYQLELAKNLE